MSDFCPQSHGLRTFAIRRGFFRAGDARHINKLGDKKMAIKVGMVSLGCSKNQVDAEIMLARIRDRGFELCTDAGSCDVVIVNTCGFIEDAKRESIENILEFCTLKKEGRIKAVVVTGCLAERYQQEIQEEIPEADVILGIGSMDKIVEAIDKALVGKKVVSFGDKCSLPLEGDRIISNLPFFAYIKVAEGCDNFCSFCAIPMIRGRYRSRTMESIVEEARKFARHGVTELNLVAQDTTKYGMDLYGKQMLPELLEQLCEIEELRWIRVLYCYPERIDDALLDVMAREPKIVKYMDIPLQHASAGLLRKMNRHGSGEEYLELIQKIRRKIPGITLRTTLIAGFPGETEEDFETLCRFVTQARFERLGCFAYSQEEGTRAGEMGDQIDDEVKQRRVDALMDLQYSIVQQQNEAMLGKTLEVLVEGYDRYASSYYGRSYMDAPDIDTKIFFTSPSPVKAGSFVTVRVEDVIDYDLLGVIEQPEGSGV